MRERWPLAGERNPLDFWLDSRRRGRTHRRFSSDDLRKGPYTSPYPGSGKPRSTLAMRWTGSLREIQNSTRPRFNIYSPGPKKDGVRSYRVVIYFCTMRGLEQKSPRVSLACCRPEAQRRHRFPFCPIPVSLVLSRNYHSWHTTTTATASATATVRRQGVFLAAVLREDSTAHARGDRSGPARCARETRKNGVETSRRPASSSSEDVRRIRVISHVVRPRVQ